MAYESDKDRALARLEEQLRKVDDLEQVMLEKLDTVKRLRRSLVIKFLWPEAFSCGEVSAQWAGTPGKSKFVIKRSDGQRREFAPADIPDRCVKSLDLPNKA